MLQCDFQFQYTDFKLQARLQMQDQLLGIMGPSGSGKSTLLKNLVGLLQPQQGFISLNQCELFDAAQQISVPMHKRHIALIFQKAWLFPHMNVQQNLQYAENLDAQENAKFKFEQVTNLLELQPLLKRRAHELSGGEAQRVSIGRALLSQPDLLLLDEPLTGLDRRLKDQILPFLNTVKEQSALPMIYVTHHGDELDYLKAHILHIENGQISF
ncbi:ATP-binding cassette domain-containing protein [Acinetobacter sp. YH12096]|uniref:ATP-binding cassette domain-containing protein n=1 Tax=Acinetobacter sp. YH12096 TaxID=2601085 RepID=UPI0015D4116B|nr:ATP-binding cassette domain-containing protein [Acinetobacter sp. YH12096]